MKQSILLGAILMGTVTTTLLAQPSERVAKEKMQQFAHWVGHWQGEGSMQMGPGPAKKTTVDETLEFKLDGTVLLVEGIGKASDPQTEQASVVHHALAILSFDQTTNEYKFNTYLKDGRSTQAWMNVISENNYQWGFDAPNGKIRYTITINSSKDKWNEVGEFSNDKGSSWMKFFEMNLKKQ
jgi:hypothetical protein